MAMSKNTQRIVAGVLVFLMIAALLVGAISATTGGNASSPLPPPGTGTATS